ncbi:protein of unknown function [Pseudorhizobium banfieldiae]|uniref:Uncharacterized protein n=1 Tax=Pseudorhizobium banfieldiae TaxID=1125847 RepID=L0NFV8_9HYPH|nr:hypothetical protein [Pseudorhizobium banfieldiae]CAD6606248.1 hypothetical protein RNT25_01822 [arsenite-oxidising bacterium NT-25]CCF19167.1 protein of unknown function [Pseudorhizobium banfieldiae]
MPTFQILDADLVKQPFTPNPDPAKGEKQDLANELLADVLEALLKKVGTRAYGAASSMPVSDTTVLSSPIIAGEVLLHASEKMYVAAVAETGTPTITDETGIPLEAGEKFHMQITTGQRIAAIRDLVDGVLHIAPVL